MQLKHCHKYNAQVNGQMVITEYDHTYFVVSTNKDIVTAQIEFDNDCRKN